MTPLLLLLAAHCLAAEPVEPKLTVNAGVVEKLKSLKPNHGMTLGKAEVVGEFNETTKKWDLQKTGPMGRDFTIKMVWATDRNRVLFCGANHGVPHRLNDVWEFDLGALTWAMIYAPDLPRDYTGIGKDYSDVEFKDGVLITKRGGPAVVAHTWWGLTYDPEAKQLLFMNTWVTDQKKAVMQLGGDPAGLYPGPADVGILTGHETMESSENRETLSEANFRRYARIYPGTQGFDLACQQLADAVDMVV